MHIVRDILGTAAYFGTYETTKQLLTVTRSKPPRDRLGVAVAGYIAGAAGFAVVCVSI